ncbi:hypothetical protein HAX54_000273, partial [Datura stramonium]|nr:hypothetical protein [Datura stramonium]
PLSSPSLSSSPLFSFHRRNPPKNRRTAAQPTLPTPFALSTLTLSFSISSSPENLTSAGPPHKTETSRLLHSPPSHCLAPGEYPKTTPKHHHKQRTATTLSLSPIALVSSDQ